MEPTAKVLRGWEALLWKGDPARARFPLGRRAIGAVYFRPFAQIAAGRLPREEGSL